MRWRSTRGQRAYLELTGHGAGIDGPLLRAEGHRAPAYGPGCDRSRGAQIHRRPRSRSRLLGTRDARATFITTAPENGAQLEDVQKAAGHRDPSTTKLYDRRGYNPEKAARFLRHID